MTAATFIAALVAALPSVVGPAVATPTPAQLAEALCALEQGAKPRVTELRCQSSTPGYVRCTYLHWHDAGYERMAVLVSPHAGHWTVSEGPIHEKVVSVRRK